MSAALAPRSPSAILAERVHDFFSAYPRALAGDEDSIHALRVAGRRLRIALRVLARGPRKRPVERARDGVRAITRSAGACRDRDVGAACLADRLSAAGASGASFGALRRRLKKEREKEYRRMVAHLLDLDVVRLRRRLRAIRARGGVADGKAAARLALLRERRGQELERELRGLGPEHAPEALHRLRIRVRRLRYAAELGHALGQHDSEPARILQELQRELGEIHDHAVLAGWLAGCAAREESDPLATTARAARALALEHVRARAGALLAADPLARVEEARRAMDGRAPAGLRVLGRRHRPAHGRRAPGRRLLARARRSASRR